MKRAVCLAFLILTLAACSKKAEEAQGPAPTLDATETSAGAPTSPTPMSLPKLTYHYAYGLEAPSEALRGLVEQHEAACANAGPAVCQILAQDISEMGSGKLHGELRLRATPDWLRGFRGGLAAQVKAAGGKVAGSSVTTDDLARPLIDAETRLKAKMLARDRLQALVAGKAGSLAELRQMQEALDAAQAEVEAIKTELTNLRAQVQMYELKLTYAPPGVLSPKGAWSPLGGAAEQSLSSLAFTASMLLQLLIWIGPWVLIAGLGFLGYRRLKPKAAI
jgi:hypothetical protein